MTVEKLSLQFQAVSGNAKLAVEEFERRRDDGEVAVLQPAEAPLVDLPMLDNRADPGGILALGHGKHTSSPCGVGGSADPPRCHIVARIFMLGHLRGISWGRMPDEADYIPLF